MPLRIKSLRELGRNVRIASSTPIGRNQKQRVPRGQSTPQLRLWEMVRQAYPDAEHEKSGLVPGRKYTVDIAIERVRLVVESDGWAFHGKYKSGFLRDREKDRALLLAGYRVVRFTAGEIFKKPHQVMETLHQVVQMIENEKGMGAGNED